MDGSVNLAADRRQYLGEQSTKLSRLSVSARDNQSHCVALPQVYLDLTRHRRPAGSAWCYRFLRVDSAMVPKVCLRLRANSFGINRAGWVIAGMPMRYLLRSMENATICGARSINTVTSWISLFSAGVISGQPCVSSANCLKHKDPHRVH